LKKIKVLFTIPNFDTAGSGKALLNIALGLNQNEFEAEILCKHEKGEFFKVVKNSGLKIHIFEYESKMRPIIKGIYSCWKVSRKLKQINPDIIHSFHYSSDYSEALAAKFAGIKWIYTKKNMNWGGNSKNSWRLRTLLAKHIIAQNTDMMKEFFPSRKNVTLIPRGVNTEYFKPLSDLNEASQNKTIICVANLVPIKGVDILINAFKLVIENHKDWKLQIVGDNANNTGIELQNLISKLKLNDNVTLIGKIQNVSDFLQNATIFVLPTLKKGRMEGSPVSLLEAMAMAKLVIGSNIPGIKDQLRDFEDFLFKSGDVSDLSRVLLKNMNLNRDEFDSITSNFRNYAVSHFDISIEINNHSKVYNKLC
jgi:glycosyltransferase involved in cell wall biosynthesis